MSIVVLIACIVELFVIVAFFYLGYLYIENSKVECDKNNMSYHFNKQKYVKQNRNVFGINEREANDIKHIYAVSPERLGF